MAFLRSIRLKGFKTFARPTELLFEQGVAVIIGPNGSGKSNVTDAVLWALGEQSPSTIRGRSMQDVIFAGSETLRPAASAEVALVFDNTSGMLRTDFQEVEITRRLDRDGQAEYRLNGSVCRLLDVQELIGRVGLGREMHSVISQGKVEELLNSTPAGRRALVEEAAGLGPFKKRRERALSKLERVQANLQRVRDVEREVRSALRPLKAQVGAATRHAELSEELAGLQARLLLSGLRVLRADLARDQEELRRVEAAKAAGEADLSVLRRGRESEEDLFTRALAEREETAARYHRAGADLDRIRSRAEALGGRVARLDGELSRAVRMRDLAESEAATAAQRLASLEAAPGCSSRRLERVQAAGMVLAGLLDECRPELVAGEALVETLKDQVLDLESQRSRTRQDLEYVKRETQEQAARRERLRSQCEGASHRAAEMEETLSSRRMEMAAAEGSAAAALVALETAAATLAQLELETAGADAALSAARESLQACLARRRVLEALAAGREGVPAAALRVLKKEGRSLLVESLQVRAGYERAVAAVLGPLAHAVLVDGSAREVLGEDAAGPLEVVRAPLERSSVDSGYSRDMRDERAAGEGTELWDVVDGPEAVLSVLRRLLPRVSVVDALGDGGGGAQVTRAGEVALGADHAARRGEPGAEAFLAARTELGRLDGEEVSARRLVEETLTARQKASDASREAAEARAAEEEQARQARRSVAGLRDELDLLQRREREAGVQAVDAASRLEKAEQRVAVLEGDALAATAKLDVLDRRVETTRHELKVAREQGDVMRARVGRLDEKRTQASLLAARLRERRRAQEEEGERARAQWSAAEARLAAARRREASLACVLPHVEALREVAASLVREFAERLSRLQADLEQSRAAAEEYAAHVKERGRREVELQQHLSGHGELLVSLQVAVARAEEQASERERELAELRRKHLSPRSLGMEDVAGASARELEDAVLAVERRRDRIGPVNPLAVQELKEAEERASFLLEQRRDLEDSLTELRRVVSDLEGHIETTFGEVFEAARRNFEEMVQVLFPGGRGTLRLVTRDGGEGTTGAGAAADAEQAGDEDGAGPVAGIALEVRPPRKTPRSLSLLSGGEKALAAIAFLFALFLARPCPFYILDEVEAALDDVNIDRFLSLVRRYQEQTQFLIITHQHRTMEIADTLYGVAMDRDGVSRVLSRRLRRRSASESGIPPEASLL